MTDGKARNSAQQVGDEAGLAPFDVVTRDKRNGAADLLKVQRRAGAGDNDLIDFSCDRDLAYEER
jgi:hypothetical protein